jgi:hypothetical protein
MQPFRRLQRFVGLFSDGAKKVSDDDSGNV